MGKFQSVPGGGGSGGGGGDGFDALAGFSDGFLGTGYSTSVEISFIVMAVIAMAVTFSTLRYILTGRDTEDELGEATSLRRE